MALKNYSRNMYYFAACHCCYFHNINRQLMDNEVTVSLIKNYTSISNEHLTPEIKLHLITPKCKLWSSDASVSPFVDPFWAFYWPGGQAISRYILDHPAVVIGLSVLDIGCGSGACSIAATITGAKNVIANDIDRVACTASAMNGSLNDVQFQISDQDLLGLKGNISNMDCFIIGDMFYDEEFSIRLFEWLLYLQTQGKTVLIGDPGRLAFAKISIKKHMKLLAEYPLPENTCLENSGFHTTSVWTLAA